MLPAAIGARRNVQSRAPGPVLNEDLEQSRRMASEYDGVVEFRFNSEQNLIETVNSPEGEKLCAAPLQYGCNIIDHSRSAAFTVEEVEF